MKYLLLHYVAEDVAADATRETAANGSLEVWLDETTASGVNLLGGILAPARDAVSVGTRDGELLVSDGPFTETKEQVAGFDIIECANLSEAIEIAGRHPTAKGYGTIEIRAIARG